MGGLRHAASVYRRFTTSFSRRGFWPSSGVRSAVAEQTEMRREGKDGTTLSISFVQTRSQSMRQLSKAAPGSCSVAVSDERFRHSRQQRDALISCALLQRVRTPNVHRCVRGHISRRIFLLWLSLCSGAVYFYQPTVSSLRAP